MMKARVLTRWLPATRYFAKRAVRADIAKTLALLEQAGKKNPPQPGDELPR